MDIGIKVNKVYLPFMNDDTRLQIFFGGSSSGKSVFVAQRAVIDLLKNKRNYLIVRNVAKTIRKSTYNEIVKCISGMGLSDLFDDNKSDMTITCIPTGYQIIFAGLDDPEKIKSITPAKGVITDIWAEEATEIGYQAVKQLEKRLRGLTEGDVRKRITMTFNPIMKTHWIYGEYFKDWHDDMVGWKGEDILILKTTYKDNRFLTEDDIKALENEKDKYSH